MNSTNGWLTGWWRTAPMPDLHDRLMAAHAANDIGALVALYSEAADASADDNSRAFFLTHAYVFALEMAHPKTATLKARLVRMGREE